MVNPIYVLVVNGQDITNKLYENSAKMTYVDMDRESSDTLTIQVAGEWDIVPFTDRCTLWIGYTSTNVWECGTFEVQSVTIEPFATTIQATATSFNNRIKEKRDKTYKETNIKDIVSTIAERHGLEIKCNISESVKYLEQSHESDMHLLTRLSYNYGAIFKIKQDTLVFWERKSTKQHTIEVSECSNYSVTFQNRSKYGMAAVEYRDTKENRVITVTVGSEKPVLKIKEYFENREEAKRVAQKRLDEANRGTVTGSLTTYGTDIVAGNRVIINGERRLEGYEFTIKKVTHTIDGGGFKTSLEFEN